MPAEWPGRSRTKLLMCAMRQRVALEATRLRNTPEGAVASGVGDQGDHPAAALSVPFEQELAMQAEDLGGIDRMDRLVT